MTQELDKVLLKLEELKKAGKPLDSFIGIFRCGESAMVYMDLSIEEKDGYIKILQILMDKLSPPEEDYEKPKQDKFVNILSKNCH